MKKILYSLLTIGIVAGVAIGASRAFFTDTETSVGNTFTTGTIDIAVDGQNPWTNSWTNYLDKPCETNYMVFRIKNVGMNPAYIWKRLFNVINGPGDNIYPTVNPVASSEPEYQEGLINGAYVERDNLSAFMIYDMYICKVGGACSFIDSDEDKGPDLSGTTDWQVIVDEADQVRVDNIVGTWIQLNDALQPNEEMIVVQSYHLMTWDDSGQPMITNWAQGDTMTFDVELEARQLTAPAPGVTLENGVERATAKLVQKNTTTWDPVPGGASGTLTYDVEGDTFNYDFSATNLVADVNYQLIYYPDPWANPKVVTLIGSSMTASSGNASSSGNVELGMDLPDPADNNYPVGAKVWLVPTSRLGGTNGDELSWSYLDKFLFDLTMVNYEDTNN